MKFTVHRVLPLLGLANVTMEIVRTFIRFLVVVLLLRNHKLLSQGVSSPDAMF